MNTNQHQTQAACAAATTHAQALPHMDIDHVKALEDIAEVISAVLCDVPDRIHKAALRDALQTILDVAVENDHRGNFGLFEAFGAETGGQGDDFGVTP